MTSSPPVVPAQADVSIWILAGGEGRRMNGQDKGLLRHRGQALVEWMLRAAEAWQMPVGIVANRHADDYRTHLDRHIDPTRQLGVHPDDADLPPRSGPMAGLLTAARHSTTPWLLILPCDTPMLPHELLPRLRAEAERAQAGVAVPITQPSAQESRPHWVCALVRKGETPMIERAFVNGERKIGRWIQSRAWVGVCFARDAEFENINTLETLHDRD